MKKTLEKLWNEYLMDECSDIETEEERTLMSKTADLYKAATDMLNEEQKVAVEKFTDSLCDLEALFIKKAFCKGCEFSVSFLFEAGNLCNDFKF